VGWKSEPLSYLISWHDVPLSISAASPSDPGERSPQEIRRKAGIFHRQKMKRLEERAGFLGGDYENCVMGIRRRGDAQGARDTVQTQFDLAGVAPKTRPRWRVGTWHPGTMPPAAWGVSFAHGTAPLRVAFAATTYLAIANALWR